MLAPMLLADFDLAASAGYNQQHNLSGVQQQSDIAVLQVHFLSSRVWSENKGMESSLCKPSAWRHHGKQVTQAGTGKMQKQGCGQQRELACCSLI